MDILLYNHTYIRTYLLQTYGQCFVYEYNVFYLNLYRLVICVFLTFLRKFHYDSHENVCVFFFFGFFLTWFIQPTLLIFAYCLLCLPHNVASLFAPPLLWYIKKRFMTRIGSSKLTASKIAIILKLFFIHIFFFF